MLVQILKNWASIFFQDRLVEELQHLNRFCVIFWMQINLKFWSPSVSLCSDDYDPCSLFTPACLQLLQALAEQNNLHCATAFVQWRQTVFKCCLYYVFHWMPSYFIINIIQYSFSSLTSLAPTCSAPVKLVSQMMIHYNPYNFKTTKNSNVLDFFVFGFGFGFFLYSQKCFVCSPPPPPPRFSLIWEGQEGISYHPSIALFHWVFCSIAPKSW